MKKPASWVMFAAVIVFLIIYLTPKVMLVRDLQIRSKNLEAELKKLQFENRQMENELRMLRDDPVYLEKVAREKFNKARQGEIVYKVVREGETAARK